MKTSNTILRLAKESDKDHILNLLNNVFIEQQRSAVLRGAEFWDWKYKQNVFGHSILSVAEHKGEIIGFDNLWPWEFRSRGETIKAVQPCDSAVHKQFRGRGIFKEMRMHGYEKALQQNISFSFNFPNANSLQGNLSLGAHYIGKISWWVKILKPVNLFTQILFNTKSKPYLFDEKYQVDSNVLDEINEESKLLDKYLKVNRIDGFHQWRYVNKPNRNYGMVVYESGRKRSVGVFTVNQKGSGKEFVIVDFVGDVNTAEGLIRRLVEVAKDLDSDFIATMHNPQFINSNLYKFGFFRKKLKNMVVLPLTLNVEEKLHDFSAISLVAGMHDSI